MSHRPNFPGPENDDRILFWSLIAATAIIVTFLILDDLGRIDIPHGGNLTLPQYLSQEREQ